MAMTKDELFRQPLYMLHVTGWPAEAVRPAEPLQKRVAWSGGSGPTAATTAASTSPPAPTTRPTGF